MKILFYAIILFMLLACNEPKNKVEPYTFWENDYAIQTRVITPTLNDSTINAEIKGNWRQFDLVSLPKEFMEWNKSKRLETINVLKDMMNSKSRRYPDLAGPHNGIVASVGYKRNDAQFSLNNAVKGMGFIPKHKKIKSVINKLEETIDHPLKVKLNILESLYEQADSLFALDRQVSLELYSSSEFMTQTFLNQMYNPVSTIVFLDIQSYKLKTIVRLLDPKDPNLTEYERDVVKYVNLVHSYFHGKFEKDFITTIYFVNQVYDNSPRARTKNGGMGRRIVPLLP